MGALGLLCRERRLQVTVRVAAQREGEALLLAVLEDPGGAGLPGLHVAHEVDAQVGRAVAAEDPGVPDPEQRGLRASPCLLQVAGGGVEGLRRQEGPVVAAVQRSVLGTPGLRPPPARQRRRRQRHDDVQAVDDVLHRLLAELHVTGPEEADQVSEEPFRV